MGEEATSFELGHSIESFRSIPRATVNPMVRTDWNIIDPVTVRPPLWYGSSLFRVFHRKGYPVRLFTALEGYFPHSFAIGLGDTLRKRAHLCRKGPRLKAGLPDSGTWKSQAFVLNTLFRLLSLLPRIMISIYSAWLAAIEGYGYLFFALHPVE